MAGDKNSLGTRMSLGLCNHAVASVAAEQDAVESHRAKRGGDMFGQRCPVVKEKLRAAAIAAERALYGNGKRRKLTFRCVELHRSTRNGGLPEKEHYDRGSVVTVDVRLSPEGAFSGGEFRTVEADGTVKGHGASFARAGPTTDEQPPFCWTAAFVGTPHAGHPACFDFSWAEFAPRTEMG